MPGKGKYTQYAAPQDDKRIFLGKLFKGHPTAGMTEQQAMKQTVNMGNALLIPDLQQGDLKSVGEVKLDFSDAPEMKDVKWTKENDPANAYVPDIRSPGPNDDGKLDDPDIKPEDIKPNYVVGTNGTKFPLETSSKVDAHVVLGKDMVKGDSGANV
jgi:hypothetical protein